MITAGVILPVTGLLQNGSNQRSFPGIIDLYRHISSCTAAGMACNANTGGVNVRKACNKLNCTIDAHSTIVKFCNRQAFRVAMTVQIKCQHHISPASQLNTIQVLHFFVVIPSFDCNNTRRRCVFGCILWNVKVCGQLVSRGTFPAHFLDPDPTRSLYSGRYDGTYKAKNQ